MHNFLLEQILLVEEEYDGRILKPRIGDDSAEERLTLLRPVLVVRLDEHLVVLAQRRQEHNGRDILEAVYPFATLRALTAHVDHAEGDILQHERILDDAGGGHTNAEYVLLCR